MKFYDNVELLGFEREEKKPGEQAYYDTATVRYTSPISGDTGIFKIIAEHIEKLNHITLDGQEEGNPSVFDLYTGAETAIPSAYKGYLYRARTDSSYELIAALVGFYYYKLPKKVRDVKAYNVDDDVRAAWEKALIRL
jgi:hypothetical protein